MSQMREAYEGNRRRRRYWNQKHFSEKDSVMTGPHSHPPLVCPHPSPAPFTPPAVSWLRSLWPFVWVGFGRGEKVFSAQVVDFLTDTEGGASQVSRGDMIEVESLHHKMSHQAWESNRRGFIEFVNFTRRGEESSDD